MATAKVGFCTSTGFKVFTYNPSAFIYFTYKNFSTGYNMLKKTLPIIIASAAMAFFGCSLTPRVQIPVQVNLNNNSGDGGNNSTSESSDASTSDAKFVAVQETAAVANASASVTPVEEPEKVEKVAMAATCEIVKLTDAEFEMKLAITDSGMVDINLSVIDNVITTKTNIVFSDKISDSTIAKECEQAKKSEEAEVTCKDRNMSLVAKMVGVDVSMYPMIAATFQKSCENVKKTGVIEAAK